ncbi:exodeoxyribonuclease III [Paraburkholderia rhizosphaerae]|uniref:Exodeoxyribonuclease III n=1 Tax=Paraburkholderia rhizosphaerae TaxID=480658 RepID=A0A4R8LLE9_9BURK|nr:exodeoxyribonuclease III [Paraburkholderia rhizosphaerae]TDY45364.1 exodeoxyribonuclease III [Paraburkholderia rhizosphaerae]
MKLATFNINGIRSRLPSLLAWLDKEQPDIACLQELKAPDSAFPADELRDAGYGAIWHGQTSWNGVAILAKGTTPTETRRGLPGGDADTHSRYIEAAVDGLLVGCLYLPNGNPQPGPKFDYKLAWFERLIAYAQTLYESGHPIVLAGDYNVVPTDFDIYNTRSWLKDALLQPESRECYTRLLAQGWTDALRSIYPDQKVFTFWDYFRRHWETNSGLRIDHLLLSASVAPALRSAGVDTWVRGEPHASDHAPAWIELDPGKLSGKAASTGAAKKVAKNAAAQANEKAGKHSAQDMADLADQAPQTTPARRARKTAPVKSSPTAAAKRKSPTAARKPHK